MEIQRSHDSIIYRETIMPVTVYLYKEVKTKGSEELFVVIVHS